MFLFNRKESGSIPNVLGVAHYTKLASQHKFLVLNFTAAWCGPCQSIKPLVDAAYPFSHTELARVDLDLNQELASKFSVTSIPTFVFVESGSETERLQGASREIILKLNQFNEKAKRAGGRPIGRTTGRSVGNSTGKIADRVASPPRSSVFENLARSINNIPPVTRFFTLIPILIGLSNGLYQYDLFLLNCNFSTFDLSLSSLFNSYRFLTAFFIPLGMYIREPISALMDMYFFYTFANHLESPQGKFKGNFPDCLWFTLITGTIIIGNSFIFYLFGPPHMFFHHQMMLSCVTYLWSRDSKNSNINFMGIIPIKGYYLPFFNLGLKLLTQGYESLIDSVLGMLGGYFYQCIASGTLPFFNLVSGNDQTPGNRVGMNTNFDPTHIDDSIFDKGYLKAPVWLYKVLKYPLNANERSSNEKEGAYASTSGYELGGAFQGRGHRLGG